MFTRDAQFQIALNDLLEAHTPSLSDENEQEIIGVLGDFDSDVADYALRTCRCGARIDGYYEYVDHLREVSGLRRDLT